MMKPFAALLAAAALSAPQFGLADTQPTRLVLPTNVTPLHYDITVKPDAAKLSFSGSVKIDIEIHDATNLIKLDAADLSFDKVQIVNGPGNPKIALDKQQQTASFSFAKEIAPGRYTLAIEYHGKIYQQASGLFALDYDTGKGKKRALFTQFEPTDARRFIPSFDEPADKATFTLSAIVPADETASSNMPVASTAKLDDKLVRVSFAKTPKMSTYLLYFGLGDFERISKIVDGVDIGVIVKRGDTASAQFALESAAQILPYYNDYFGQHFPLPKLDLIAAPGTSQFFGAMENWGAILYFEEDLLIDPRIATEEDRQRVYVTEAHEMAHQWFGDLVTMAWWDDLWLNEGFATWMESKVTDHFHPEWKVGVEDLGYKNAAMQTDATAGSHAIVQPIYDILQASGAFDEITYAKGASVIRMLETYTGETAWRDGVRRYIAAHAYGNAVSDDLWREIDAVAKTPITQIAHDFTLRPGLPMIEVAAASPSGITLTQSRFGVDAVSKTPKDWPVPVRLEQFADPVRYDFKMVSSSTGPVTLADPVDTLANAGQTGYFRTLYDAKPFAAVAERYPSLSPEDQFGILEDTSAEAFAGYTPMGDVLELITKLPSDGNPLVETRMVKRLQRMNQLYANLPGLTQFRAYAISRLHPLLNRLGWDTKPGEPPNTEALRIAVLDTLGEMGDEAVIAEAKRRFASLVAGQTLKPSERKAVLAVIGINADQALWDQIHNLAKHAKTDLEKREYYDLLGHAADAQLAEKALTLALSGEPAPTTAPDIIHAASVLHAAMVLKFVDAHWTKLAALIDTSAAGSFAPSLVMHANDPAVAVALDQFGEAHLAPTARGDIPKAKAAITLNAEIRSSRLPDADKWLTQHGPWVGQ
jgi:aminopeptidase N